MHAFRKASGSRVVLSAAFACAACSASAPPPEVAGITIVPTREMFTASAGDVVHFSVALAMSDGTTAPLPTAAEVTWSGPPLVTALATGSSPTESILPSSGAGPTSMWLKNPACYDDATLDGVLWILDTGTAPHPSIGAQVTVTGGGLAKSEATVRIPITPFPPGDARRGQVTFAANCAACHGAHGEGGTGPGLDAEPGNMAGDPTWTPALFGIAARADIDNMGVPLDSPMPRWLVRPAASGQLLSTQDFADMYAFLATQNGPAAD
jgi:mono/diheme cytochrome c family protein